MNSGINRKMVMALDAIATTLRDHPKAWPTWDGETGQIIRNALSAATETEQPMTFVDAMRYFRDHPESPRWARPICWRKAHSALAVDGDDITLIRVSGAHGPWNAPMPTLIALLDEWEIVDPADVIEGR